MVREDAQIELREVAELKAAERNARTHSQAQVDQIARSIQKFGFTTPLLIDEAGQIVAGHGRLAAAKKLHLVKVPCRCVGGLSDDDKRALALADNKLALNAGWDVEILALELAELTALGFDMELTGFELPEIDLILSDAAESSPLPVAEENETPPRPTVGETVSVKGDVWVLGRHRLACGDAQAPALLAQLLGGEKADAVFTDPPYNVPIHGHVSGLGQHKHREFEQASGEMTSEQYTEFLGAALENIIGSCRDGAIVFTCMDWRHLPELFAAGCPLLGQPKNLCVWNKTNAGMGAFYRSQHEMVLVWKVGDAPHTNNFGLGDKGRYRTNVWTYAGVNTFRRGRDEELAMHPTVKPVALVADAIKDVTHRGQLVLDAFGGSGTTLIAAEKTGRRAALLEIDPSYCDVTIRRWQAITGKQATNGESGSTFEQVTRERLGTTGWAAVR